MRDAVIICGKLFDGIRPELQEKQEILIRGGKIAQVAAKVDRPADCEVIDLSDATVTPGMIDAHTHLTFFEWSKRRQETLFNSPANKGMAVLHNAEKALRRGFTTLRHMGGNCDDGYGALEAKRVIAQGYFKGSRLVVLPYTQCTPGSHGDFSQMAATNADLARYLCSSFPCMGTGADFFRDSVRLQVKYGADFVKIMLGGGFSTPNDGPADEQMTDEEMIAIIETAHNLKKKVTAHVYAAASAVKLAKLGIDELQHCAMLDEEGAAQLEAMGIPVVPTFSPYEEIIHPIQANLDLMEPDSREKYLSFGPQLTAGRKVIVNSKLELGYGSDQVTIHRSYEGAYEYRAWLRSGMDPFRTLMAATSVNARLLQLDHLVGTLEPGKVADISAWRRDLLTDPDALMDCAFVMKEGRAYRTEPTLVD